MNWPKTSCSKEVWPLWPDPETAMPVLTRRNGVRAGFIDAYSKQIARKYGVSCATRVYCYSYGDKTTYSPTKGCTGSDSRHG